MKAYVINSYGPPEAILRLKDEKPKHPGDTEVKIQVCATTVNDYDWCICSGKPWEYRLLFGLLRQRKKLRIPGMEVAGIVHEIGKHVTRFKPGDEVYGDISDYGFGSYAEFLCIDEKALHPKPQKMSFEEAASIPHAAMLALQGLRDAGEIRQGQKVLINGGGGGMGAFAVQIAKYYNSQVTGVDRKEKLDAMKTLGYDHVIDYNSEDFTKGEERYDLILDCRTNRSLWKYLKVLKPHGKYVTVGGRSGKLLQMLFMNPLLKIFSNKRTRLVMLAANRDLDFIEKLYDEHKLRCQIDGPYSFEEIPRAVQRFGDAQHVGKIVISVRS
ncbi:NAD(P)-dependent alcohol dehydrogenase [Muriicola marianensis]|uniref:NADPH:quinone reductase n=1 Tax=Muriicola marianensis TaxID=1324801 RepID=A0ABQ1QT88_9FLAO|nr:NAD(P)-dependent alcohol dehydrogenase [Muriicola marianensis]GGD40281.1 NADPH:quinone reductase [Muriicola marianensis]